MGIIIKEIETGSLEELIKALQSFPSDMRLEFNGDSGAVISHVVPDEGDVVEDQRGYLLLESK
ncbi:MAG: hypothetical protein LLG40_15570 [Deltaproteobacteria bacterium]|nr:hypothetical protein [Deltaproteobacteria bacterium]